MLAAAPPFEPLLALLEVFRGQHLLREEPAVAADGEQVLERRVVQSQVGVGSRRAGKEAAYAFY